jgi:hypothetical protein
MKKEMNRKLKISKTKNMKPYLLIFAMLLGAVCSWGQTATDEAAVLQKCLGMPQVAQYYQRDVVGIPVSLYAVASVQLTAGLDISFSGRKVTFGTQAQMDAIKADAYFIFTAFELAGDNASVSFNYCHHCNSGKQVIQISIKLQKSGGLWNITETNETGR